MRAGCGDWPSPAEDSKGRDPLDNTGLLHLAVAYGAFFLLLALYLDRLRRRDRELWRRVRELEGRLQGSDGGADA